MNIFKSRKKSIYFISYICLMIFVQGCSTGGAKSSSSSKDTDDDKTIKTDNSNLDKPQINLVNTCPRGLACAFPGRCTLYTDRNYDKLCDRSTTQERYYDRGL